MSFINQLLPPGFAGAEAGSYQPPGAGNGGAAPPILQDAIAPSAYGNGYGGGWNGGGWNGGGWNGGGLYGGASSGSTGLGGFAGIMNAFMSMLSNALTSLGNLVGGGTSTSPPGSGTTGPAAPQQQYFANATASSAGDPHDAFSGTNGNGTNAGATWDNMQGHADLLSSDSFAGGYRVSTTPTAPQANGVTYNASATVAARGGAADVTMNANGSYQVTADGRNVSLTQGQAVSLGGGETVTLQADGSLSVADTNARGGTIDTTLASNGDGGVDVHATASNVDLGGYLVRHVDGGTDPVAGGGNGWYGGGTSAPIAYSPIGVNGTNGALGTSPFGPFTNQFGGSSPLGGLEQLLQTDAPL